MPNIAGPFNGVIPSNDQLVTFRYTTGIKAYVQGLQLNTAAPADLTTLVVPSSKYVPTRAFVFNPTGNMSAASLGLYTAPAAGGTVIISPVALASLTGVGKFQALSIAALTDVITATVLYPRLTVASGVAGTVTLLVEMAELSLL